MSEHLHSYLLYLADNALIIAHRNSEWCGHGPVLEQDIALTNVALDLLGQARNFYQYAAVEIGGAVTEDSLAYLRDAIDFKNCLLVEQPNGDWAQTILKQFFFSTYQYYLYQQLQFAKNNTVAAIAQKALKEVTYHVRWSSEWVIRLGDGTQESNKRMTDALQELWRFTGELFMAADYETIQLKEWNVNLQNIQEQWHNKVSCILNEATLTLPQNAFMQTGGKQGVHSEHLGYILAEMQFLQRAYPNSIW